MYYQYVDFILISRHRLQFQQTAGEAIFPDEIEHPLDYGKKELINTVFRVPVSSIENNRIAITLQHRSVLSAAELGLSRDTRKIKFGLTELVIEADDQEK